MKIILFYTIIGLCAPHNNYINKNVFYVNVYILESLSLFSKGKLSTI